MNNSKAKTKAYAISLLTALGTEALSWLVNAGKMKEYFQMEQPPLTPPSWVFPLVWTVLFVLMGIGAARVALSGDPGKSDALFVYGAQLVVNFLWTVFYFSFNARLLAFFWLIFLLLLVLLMVSRFRAIDETAGKLQIPYVLWLIFAGYLNLAAYLMNR